MTKQISFPFILDYLDALNPRVGQMFGCHSIYIGEKIVFVTRDRDSHTECNGIWIATSHEHHQSLKKEFPSLCSISVLNGGTGETGWQMLPAEADVFESSAIKACELVLHRDPRIGKIPKVKKKKK